jgi:heptaprenyl diphosphate synthase
VLLALRSDQGTRLRQLIDGDLTNDADLAEALQLLQAHDGLTEARTVLQRYADEARDSLAPLPDNAAKAALTSLCDVVVARPA